MVGLSLRKFNVVLLTPKAQLLSCRCGSLVLPAHDGQLGILRNHCPVLTELGYGIMQVFEIADRPDAFFLISGGFARVGENNVTVLAYDVTTFEGMDDEAVEQLVSQAHSVMAGQDYISTQQEVIDHRKAQFIIRMAQMTEMRSRRPKSGQ